MTQSGRCAEHIFLTWVIPVSVNTACFRNKAHKNPLGLLHQCHFLHTAARQFQWFFFFSWNSQTNALPLPLNIMTAKRIPAHYISAQIPLKHIKSSLTPSAKQNLPTGEPIDYTVKPSISTQALSLECISHLRTRCLWWLFETNRNKCTQTKKPPQKIKPKIRFYITFNLWGPVRMRNEGQQDF